MEGLVDGFMKNRPCYLQWNIPLFDDDTLWVCPGSHVREASEAEERDLEATAQLSERHDGLPPSATNSGPIGEAVPVKLRAGDGVVYLNTILHWSAPFALPGVGHCLADPSLAHLQGIGLQRQEAPDAALRLPGCQQRVLAELAHPYVGPADRRQPPFTSRPNLRALAGLAAR